jgi:hypothetical protein
MYTRFLESLFESQSYPNENEHDPLGSDVSIYTMRFLPIPVPTSDRVETYFAYTKHYLGWVVLFVSKNIVRLFFGRSNGICPIG